MIMQNKIELNFDDKLRFFKIPIILFLISAFCFFYGFTDISSYSLNELNNVSNKFGVILLLIGLILFIKQKNNLRFITVNQIIDIKIFKEHLNELVNVKKWKIDFLSENHAIIKTDSMGSLGRYFLAKSYGELIHILIAQDKVYYKSIFDVDKNPFITIPSGENKTNEKTIKNLILSLNKKHT